jgi:hypothetical protein
MGLVRFQAGLWIEGIHLHESVTASFRSPPGISNLLEGTASLTSSNWFPLAAPLRVNNNLQTFVDTNVPVDGRFYRLRQLNNLP